MQNPLLKLANATKEKGHEKKRKQEIRDELAFIEKLEEDGNIDHEIFGRKIDLLVELNGILINEELFLLQQSKERWLLGGTETRLIIKK